MSLTPDEIIDGARAIYDAMQAELPDDLKGVPWQLYGESEEGEPPEPDDFDDYEIWVDDGQPGTCFIAKGICQGRDEGLAMARFIVASPEMVHDLLKVVDLQRTQLREKQRLIDVAEAFLDRSLDELTGPGITDG